MCNYLIVVVAVVVVLGMGIEGLFVWTLKDKIDRTWILGYQVVFVIIIDIINSVFLFFL